jgi:hypothetical protein
VSCTSSQVPSVLHWCPGSVSYKHMSHTTTARQPAHRHACRSHCHSVSYDICILHKVGVVNITSKDSLPPPDVTAEIHGCSTGKHVKWSVSLIPTSYLLLQSGYNPNSLVQNVKFGFNFVCFKMRHAHAPQLLKCLIYVFHPYPATNRTDNVFRLGWRLLIFHIPVMLLLPPRHSVLFAVTNSTNKMLV